MAPAGHFVPFGLDHLIVLAMTGSLAAGLIVNRRRVPGASDERLRRIIAVLLLSNELVSLGVAVMQGKARVPFQLCDLALFVTVAALWQPRRLVSEFAYFWGVTGSLQALLTPDLEFGFPNYWWVTFFLTHCGVVLSAIYLGVTGRVIPTAGSIWRVFGFTNLYALIAGILNWRWGTNYGYLAHKPSQPSLLDYFGPWPYYIVVMEVAALSFFVLAYVPFILTKPRAQQAM